MGRYPRRIRPLRLLSRASGPRVRRPRLDAGLLYGATLANFTSMGLYFAAIPLFVSQELNGSNTAVGVSLGAFAVSAVLLRPTIGRGVDAYGRRPFLVAALVIQIVAALGFELAGSVPVVIVLRLVQGVAGACFYTAAAAAATDLSPPAKRAGALARLSVFLYLGFAGGPVLGEWAIRTVGFAWTWLLVVGMFGVGLVLALALPETGEPTGRRAPEPGRRRRLLHPAAVVPGVILATAGVGYASIATFSPIYAREIGMSSSGLLYAAFAITILAVRVLAGGAADRFGFLRVALPGIASCSLGMATLALFPEPATALLGVAVFGVGFALLFPALAAYTVSKVRSDERGEALGSFTAFMDVGTAAGGYVVGSVADQAGFRWAYATPALLAAGGLVALLGLRRSTAGQAEPEGQASSPPAL